jgi:hypothetical protein
VIFLEYYYSQVTDTIRRWAGKGGEKKGGYAMSCDQVV